MTGFFADAFFSPGVFVESGSSVEAGLTFFLTGLFSGFSEISAVSSLLIGLEAFGRTGFPSASVSLRLFAGFAPAFFSVSFTFSASEPAADLLTGGFLAAGLSSAAPFLDTDDSAGLTATLLSALSTGFASAGSASFFCSYFPGTLPVEIPLLLTVTADCIFVEDRISGFRCADLSFHTLEFFTT